MSLLDDDDDLLVPEISTVELSRIVRFYCKNVRPHSPKEMTGIYRNLQRLCNQKGVTLEMLQTAVENYAADPYVRASDPRARKNIRSFFTYDNVVMWQQPVRQNPLMKKKPVESALDALERLEQ
jgi:hypothetical protein